MAKKNGKTLAGRRKLTAEDRELIEQAFIYGPCVLFRAGMDVEECRLFLLRPDVVRHFEVLESELRGDEALQSRQQFYFRRKVMRMAPQALDVLQMSLRGNIYATDREGRILNDAMGHKIIMDPSPTGMQLGAAQDVLDRAGVSAEVDRAAGNEAMIRAMFAQMHAPVVLDYEEGASDRQRALSRERMRSVIEQIKPKLLGMKKKIDKRLFKPLRDAQGDQTPAEKDACASKDEKSDIGGG